MWYFQGAKVRNPNIYACWTYFYFILFYCKYGQLLFSFLLWYCHNEFAWTQKSSREAFWSCLAVQKLTHQPLVRKPPVSMTREQIALGEVLCPLLPCRSRMTQFQIWTFNVFVHLFSFKMCLSALRSRLPFIEHELNKHKMNNQCNPMMLCLSWWWPRRWKVTKEKWIWKHHKTMLWHPFCPCHCQQTISHKDKDSGR